MSVRRPIRRPTIYDVATAVGTSPSAVSSVLNGTWRKRRISEQLAERVRTEAASQGYAINLQASALRRETSRVIGMILPKYDNRYFGAIAERFETMARARGLFPIVTCTQRDPDLEAEAARAMISHQVTCLVATGTTDPDRIADLCEAAGVRTINLDLPGRKSPSVISDNFTGARDLTRCILAHLDGETGRGGPLLFVGGRAQDHNTRERVRGFRAAHAECGRTVAADHILPCGYAPDKAERALDGFLASGQPFPAGLFVNSTIALEGVVRWLRTGRRDGHAAPRVGCFDFDAFAACIEGLVGMVRQDVPTLLDAVFGLIDAEPPPHAPWVEVPTILVDVGAVPSDRGVRTPVSP